MNVFYKVTLQSLKQNRTRTTVTIIGIILSTAMVCAVTTLASSFINYALQTAIYNYGDWHGSERNTNYETYENILASEDIENAVYTQQLGYAVAEGCQNEFKPYIYLVGASEGIENTLPIHITEGEYPSTENEILLPNHLAENGGVKYHIGDILTLELGIRILDGYPLTQNDPSFTYVDQKEVLNSEILQIRETRTYTVVGFYERFPFDLEGYYAPGYTTITLADKTPSESYLYDVYFKMKNAKDIYDFMEKNGMSGNTNVDVLLYSGISQYDNFKAMIYSLAAIVIGLIVFGSISLIYNAFSISVSERTKQFGLLSSVGATKKQLRKMVFFEAFLVSAIGIPIGVLSGVAGIGITLIFVGDNFDHLLSSSIAVELSVSSLSIVVAVVLALVIVLLSAWIPSKRATKVSAVEAIRQTTDIYTDGKPIKTSKWIYQLFGFSGMLANKHYKRNKKRYRITIVSLFMSIVLFVSASAFTDYLMELATGRFSTNSYDLRFFCFEEDFTNISKDELLELLKADTNITNAAYTQCRRGLVEVDKNYLSEEAFENLSLMTLASESGADYVSVETLFCFVNNSEYKKLLNQYKLDESVYSNPESPLAIAFDGSTNFSNKEEKYITLNVLKSDECEATFLMEKEMEGYQYGGQYENKDGDLVNCYIKEDNSEEILEIPVEESSEKIIVRSGKTIYEWPYFVEESNGLVFVYPESMKSIIFPNLNMENYGYRYLLTSDNHKESYTAVKQTLTKNGFNTSSLYDYAQAVESDKNFVLTIQVFSYGFIVLISLVAAANVFHTISTNISLRRREFAMLKSVGMSEKDFQRMMNFECILYGTRALLYGLPVSVGITYLIYLAVSEGYSTGFHLQWGAMGIAVLSVFAVVFATMMYSMSKIKKDNPIDALKNENI